MNAHALCVGRCTIGLLACAGALLLVSGCVEPAQRHDEFAVDTQETLSIDEVMERQATAGAIADATLNNSHFDGNMLNERGRMKLNAMVQKQGGPSTVYVDVADNAPARIDAVTKYLKDAGASSQNLKVEAGPNPNNTVAAVEGLSRMKKTESSAQENGGGRSMGMTESGTGSSATPSGTSVISK
jgi:hypothetical protein